MLRRRIISAVWLVLAATLHVFGNNAGTFALLVASVAAPAISIVAAVALSRRVRVELQLDDSVAAGGSVSGKLRVSGTRLLAATVLVACDNRFTGERVTAQLPSTTTDFALTTEHCGLLRVSVEQVEVFDLFSLFRKTIRPEISAEAYAAPTAFDARVTLADDVDLAADSDEYSMTRPGSDPSETFAIREYRPGDPIKRIHWKLSNKSDRLMVRELGLPVVRRVLMLLETSSTDEPIPPQALHASAEVLCSLSRALVDMEIPHVVGWHDADGALETVDVTDHDDVDAAMRRCLSIPCAAADTSISDLYIHTHGRCAYAHVAVVSPCPQPSAERLRGGNRVTVLSCSGSPSRGGVYNLAFGETSYKNDLSELEL